MTVAGVEPDGQAAEVVNIEGRQGVELKRNALGLSALFFCIATAAAPLTALLFNTPVVVSGAGWAAPAAFLIGFLALAVFTVGYVELAKRVTTAGGFYSFITYGFGRAAGLGTAWLVTGAYATLSAAIQGVFAYFTNLQLNSWLHINIPVTILLAILIAVNFAFAFFDIQITARVLGVCFVAEVVASLLFALVVVLKGGAHGLTAAPLNPFKVFDNPSAIKVFGAAAPGIALFGAFWSWVGYETAPNYGEESRHTRRILPWATFGTLALLAFIYIFVTYAFVVGWGPDHAAQAVNAQYQGKTISAYYPLTSRFVGGWLTDVFEFLIMTSTFACQLAFFNTSSRYLFALGREGLAPKPLARTHKKHATPYVASGAVAVALIIFDGAFELSDGSTGAVLSKLGTWAPLFGVLALLAIQGLTSFAVVRYFLTTGREHFHPVRTFLAPLLGGVLMFVFAYLLIDNRGALSGAGDAAFIKLFPWAVLVIFVIGLVIALWYRLKDPDRYEAVGRFVHEDA